MSRPKIFDQQAAADKEARRLVKIAHKTGGTVPYSLGRLIDLKFSIEVIRAVSRSPINSTTSMSPTRLQADTKQRNPTTQPKGQSNAK